jgi:hypothetical protein
MEQSDYLLRQIELMTQTLANLIRRLMGIKEISEEEAEQTTNELLEEYLHLSIKEIVNTPLDEIVDRILQHDGMYETNMDLFAEILVLNAKNSGDERRQMYLLERGLAVYDWLDRKSGTFSAERHRKMNEIKNLMNSLH